MKESLADVAPAEPDSDEGMFLTFVDGMVVETIVSEGRLFALAPRKPNLMEASYHVMDQPDGANLSPYEVISRAGEMSGQHYADEGGYPLNALRHAAYELIVRRGWYDNYYPNKPYPDDCWMLGDDVASISFQSSDSALPW